MIRYSIPMSFVLYRVRWIHSIVVRILFSYLNTDTSKHMSNWYRKKNTSILPFKLSISFSNSWMLFGHIELDIHKIGTFKSIHILFSYAFIFNKGFYNIIQNITELIVILFIDILFRKHQRLIHTEKDPIVSIFLSFVVFRIDNNCFFNSLEILPILPLESLKL